MASSDIKVDYSVTQTLAIGEVFETLTPQEKIYAHHMARAAWHGARIVLRQCSPESEMIFDFILELHRVCAGEWRALLNLCELSESELEKILGYAGLFLGNLGNYFSEGGQKIVLPLPIDAVIRLGGASTKTGAMARALAVSMTSTQPANIGFPSGSTQSEYYPGRRQLRREEIAAVTKAMQDKSLEPENTRLRADDDDPSIFHVLQASIEQGTDSFETDINGIPSTIHIDKGDHSDVLTRVCESLRKALQYAPTEAQKDILGDYIASFATGSLESYRQSQERWVVNKEPIIEDIFGFVESYRDPLGVRAEWESIVAVSNAQEGAVLRKLVERSPDFIRPLPWALGTVENGGKGPFERDFFEAPDFSSVHALAYCSSIIFEGINLPNYNDIRETCGYKNVIVANRMQCNLEGMKSGSLVAPEDMDCLGRCRHRVRFVSTAVHELLGHGTGKLLHEDSKGCCNFDKEHQPLSPVTGKPVETWYKSGQVWTTVFEDIATSVEECRASLVAAYLMSEPKLTEIFGYSETSEVTHDELLYNTFLMLGIEGVEALRDYSTETKTWGQAHSRGHFAILNQLLRHSDGCVTVEYLAEADRVNVKVDRMKILTHGKKALGDMLLKLHIYRCTADVNACRPYYENLTIVESEHDAWRDVVVANPEPRRSFVQCNTFLQDGLMTLEEYDPTNEGMIQSWAKRDV